ncbi:hypothetical protein P7K49_000571, partial [Saguinus oedipus]
LPAPTGALSAASARRPASHWGLGRAVTGLAGNGTAAPYRVAAVSAPRPGPALGWWSRRVYRAVSLSAGFWQASRVFGNG